jgi:hypothetical protein
MAGTAEPDPQFTHPPLRLSSRSRSIIAADFAAREGSSSWRASASNRNQFPGFRPSLTAHVFDGKPQKQVHQTTT